MTSIYKSELESIEPGYRLDELRKKRNEMENEGIEWYKIGII
mgnify:CR=1 FL=1